MKNVYKRFLNSTGARLTLAGLIGVLAVSQTSALSGVVSPAPAPAVSADLLGDLPVDNMADVPTSITFGILATSCGNSTYTFKIGNLVAGSVNDTSCTCGPGLRTVTVDLTQPANAALQAAVGAPQCAAITAESNPYAYLVGYVNTSITRSESGVESICLFDSIDGNNCSSGGPRGGDNVCNSYSNFGQNSNFSYVAPTDPVTCDPSGDFDGDGVANNVDNCPANSNVDQADTNGDGIGNVCSRSLAAVPWGGNEAKSHATRSGASFLLHASASLNGKPFPLASGSWDPGDGTGPVSINVSNSRALELEHTYTGAVGTPFTATITVTDTDGKVYTDTQKVQIQVDALDTKANMAIDRALWYNHKYLTLSGTTPSYASCADSEAFACTSGAMQAFEVNGHRESGDFSKDPYVDDVARGLRWLQNGIRRRAITAGGGALGNGDTNGNGYGLEDPGNEPVYVGGQIVDAFVASGTKTKVATVGSEAGRTYADIVADLMDTYSFGMNDQANQGGWVYNWNDNSGIDSSSSGWWGVGGHAAEVWGITQPQWVKDHNLNVGINSLQYLQGTPHTGSYGACSYRAGPGDGGTADTAACGIMLSLDGQSRSSARFTAMEKRLRRGFPNDTHNNIYAMYNVTKAMRLAKDDSGNPAPIVMMDGDKDWYGDLSDGFAQRLISSQAGDGRLATFGGWASGALANSWGILILSPALFEQGPTAVCSVDASTICQAGATGGCNTTGTNPYATVNFDGSQSIAGDNPIATYSWNFQDGGSAIDATTVTASTSYGTVGTYNVQLTVADTKGNSSSVTCPVSVTSSALPPIADAGGPYRMCIGTNSLILDATASTGRGSNIVSYEWDFKGAINFAAIDATGATSDQTSYFQGLGLGTYDVGLRIKDDNQPINTITDFTTVTVADCDPPVITVPSNISIVTLNSSAPVSFAVSATDNVDTSVSVTCVSTPTAGLSSGSNFPLGTTTVTCNATDQAGNHADPKSFTITVSNNTPPTFSASDITTTATSPAGAVVTFNAAGNDDQDGSIPAVCTPASGSTFAIGATTVNCTVTDAGGLTASGSFNVTVTNTPPTITVPADITAEATGATGTSVTFAATGSDNEDGVLVPVCTPASGSTFAIGQTSVTCTVTDVAGVSASASFNVTVVDTTKPAITAADITVHATSASGASVSFAPTATDAVDGSVSVNCDQTSAATFPIGSTTVNCTATDSHNNTATASFSISVTNAAPTAANDSQTVAEDTQLSGSVAGLANDSDGDTLAISLASNVSNGTLTFNANGSYTYQGNLNFNGSDSFSYTVNDGRGGVATGTVTITVTPVNDAPVAQPDAYTGQWNTLLTVTANGVLGNDSDIDNTASQLSAVLVTGTTHGVLSLNANGGFTYMPNANYSGLDTFTYKVTDGALTSNTVTVTLTITSPCRDDRDDGHRDGDRCDHDRRRSGHREGDGCDHDRHNRASRDRDREGDRDRDREFERGDCRAGTPIAKNDSYTTRKNLTLTVSVANGLLDNDYLAATANLISGPAHGTVTVAANGGFVYTPAAGYVGYDSFVYVARSAAGVASATATATIRIKKNDPPVADNDSYNVKKNSTLSVNKPGVMNGDKDPDGDPLTAVLVSSTTSGVLTLNANGSFTYKPNAGFTGTDSFTYKVTDVTGLASNVATVTVKVLAHWDGDGCDHDRGKKGHRDGDGCDHNKSTSGKHHDGDDCDHDNHKSGHHEGDGCEHDRRR